MYMYTCVPCHEVVSGSRVGGQHGGLSVVHPISKRSFQVQPCASVCCQFLPAIDLDVLTKTYNFRLKSTPASCSGSQRAAKIKWRPDLKIPFPLRVSPECCFVGPACVAVTGHAGHVTCPTPFCHQMLLHPAFDTCSLGILHCSPCGPTNPRYPVLSLATPWCSKPSQHASLDCSQGILFGDCQGP